MLKLLASAAGDGWAFVEKDGQVLLVRPPYQQWALAQVPREAIERAVQQFGFAAQEKTFQNWESLVGYLRDEYLAWRSEKGAEVPDSEEVRSLLHLAPPEILENYLDLVESELLPQNEWKPALDLLAYLLSVESVKTDSRLYERTIQLLLQSQEAMRDEEARKWRIGQPEASYFLKFPNAAQAYGAAAIRDLAAVVARQGQVFAFG